MCPEDHSSDIGSEWQFSFQTWHHAISLIDTWCLCVCVRVCACVCVCVRVRACRLRLVPQTGFNLKDWLLWITVETGTNWLCIFRQRIASVCFYEDLGTFLSLFSWLSMDFFLITSETGWLNRTQAPSWASVLPHLMDNRSRQDVLF